MTSPLSSTSLTRSVMNTQSLNRRAAAYIYPPLSTHGTGEIRSMPNEEQLGRTRKRTGPESRSPPSNKMGKHTATNPQLTRTHTLTHTHKQPSPPSLKCGQPAYVDDNRVVSTTDMSSWWYMRDLSISVLASSQLTTVEHPPVRSRGG